MIFADFRQISSRHKLDRQKSIHGEKLMNYSHADTYYLLDKDKNGAEIYRERMQNYTTVIEKRQELIKPIVDEYFDWVKICQPYVDSQSETGKVSENIPE